jgi:hypothetical protein
MNRIGLSGRILVGPSYHTDSDAGVQVATFALCCGGESEVVRVAATRSAAVDLSRFRNGDSISVEGRVIWREGKLEILAETIRQWTNGVYRKGAQQDKFARQIKGMRGVPLP